MPIPPIGQVLGAAGTNAIAPTSTTTSKPSGDFGKNVLDALDNLQQTQNNADALSVKAATGTLSDVHDYMIAATEATVQTEFTVAVRNKAVEAFNDIMRMQI